MGRQKISMEIPEGTYSEQLMSVIKALDKRGEIPNLGPLARTEAGSADEKGNLTLKAAVKEESDFNKDTYVTMTHYKHPKGGVGGEVIIEQASPIKPERLKQVASQMYKMGMDAMGDFIAIHWTKQLERTATSDKARVPEQGVRQLKEVIGR
jgi:hypothetical protein